MNKELLEQKNCLFCGIVRKDIHSYTLKEGESLVAILDINPESDGHTLLISKKHFQNLEKLGEKEWAEALVFIKELCKKMREKLGVDSFNFISNLGSMAYQQQFHFHFHIIPKYVASEGFIWNSNPKLKHRLETVYDLLVF